MPLTQISGLASGLDTATIISQLMQVEAKPQTMLKNRLDSQQTALSSLQSLNAKLLTIATKAGDLAKTANWSPFTATSSSDKVTVTVTSGAAASSFSFKVDNTATARRLDFDPTALTTRVTSADSTQARLTNPSGDVVTLETGDGSLDGLVKAINGAAAGIRATTLQLADGTYRVIVQAEKTGADVTFSLTNADGTALTAPATEVAGLDAHITVGTDQLKSSTNTFKGTVSGLDITLSPSTPAGTTVDVTVSRDSKAMTDSVQALVDAANAVLADISSLTAYKTSTTDGGALAGDPTLRGLRDELLSAVSGGVGGKSLADLGIQLDRYGKITFDATAFESAYTADPSGTAARFTGTAPEGFAVRLAAVADRASDSVSGTVTTAIKGRTSTIDSLEDAIADWDVRLTQRKTSLERQYAALEVALQGLQSQSSWLASQIAGLPSYDSGS